MAKPKPVFPPSLGKVPGISNAALEEEKILRRLDKIICGLNSATENDADSTDSAGYLYESFLLARSAIRQERKGGLARPSNVAKQLRKIASGSTTLLKRLTVADKHVFDAWANLAEEYDRILETPTQEWLQLKALLQQSSLRANKGARLAEVVIRLMSKDTVGKKGRPEDVLATTMTVMAAETYEEWTGSLAQRSISCDDGKPSGAFHDFLTEVFETLGIAASPDYSNDRLQKELAKLPKSNAHRK